MKEGDHSRTNLTHSADCRACVAEIFADDVASRTKMKKAVDRKEGARRLMEPFSKVQMGVRGSSGCAAVDVSAHPRSTGRRCGCCEMFARPPKGQERDGWIWRPPGAMNGMRTANLEFTEFLVGTFTEHMGFKRGKPERCLFVHESNETRVVSHVDDPLICAKPATLEKFWMQITKLVVIKRGEALNPRIPVVYLGFEYRSAHEAERRGFTVKPTAKYVDECLDTECEGSDDACDGTEDHESAR